MQNKYRGTLVQNKASIIIGFASFLLMTAPMQATPVGTLSLANCSGGGVIVTATTIDWTLPVGGGNGCIQTGVLTNVSYGSGSNLGAGVQGTIIDLTGGLPVANFLTFAGAPGLHFDLLQLGPSVSNTNCAALTLGQSCSAVVGSPFLLTLSSLTSSTVSLQAAGTAGDSVSSSSIWSGGFTTQIANMTPAQIQAAISTPGGSVASTYSGDFRVTIVGGVSTVPEPGTAMLFGTGILLISMRLIKRINS